MNKLITAAGAIVALAVAGLALAARADAAPVTGIHAVDTFCAVTPVPDSAYAVDWFVYNDRPVGAVIEAAHSNHAGGPSVPGLVGASVPRNDGATPHSHAGTASVVLDYAASEESATLTVVLRWTDGQTDTLLFTQMGMPGCYRAPAPKPAATHAAQPLPPVVAAAPATGTPAVKRATGSATVSHSAPRPAARQASKVPAKTCVTEGDTGIKICSAPTTPAAEPIKVHSPKTNADVVWVIILLVGLAAMWLGATLALGRRGEKR